MEKKTVLDENAEIYKKNRDKVDKKELKNLSGAEKRRYFMDYYFKFVLVGIVALIAVVYLLYTSVFHRKNYVLNVALVGSISIDSETLESELRDYLGLTSSKDVITISAYTTEDAYSNMAVTTRISAGDLDLIIAEEDSFDHYIENGTFLDLSEFLPESTFSSFTASSLIKEGKTAEYDLDGNISSFGEETPYGINISNQNAFSDIAQSLSDCYLGVMVNSKNPENVLKCIEFFYS